MKVTYKNILTSTKKLITYLGVYLEVVKYKWLNKIKDLLILHKCNSEEATTMITWGYLVGSPKLKRLQ